MELHEIKTLELYRYYDAIALLNLVVNSEGIDVKSEINKFLKEIKEI